MLKIFLFLLSLPLLLYASDPLLEDEAALFGRERVIDRRENYFMTSTSQTPLPKVNPLTGEYNEESLDLVVAGCQPLSVRRFYSSSAPYDGRHGGWRYNPETFMAANFDLDKQEIFAAVGEAGGGISSFKRSDNHFIFTFDPPKSFMHFTPGGQDHPLNTKIEYQIARDPKDYKNYQFVGTIREGNGSQRTFMSPRHRWLSKVKYSYTKKTFFSSDTFSCKVLPTTWTPYQIPIIEERLPNGNILCYDYEIWKKGLNFPRPNLLRSITAYNSTRSKVLAKIEFEYPRDKEKDPSAIIARGSDRRKVHVLHQQEFPKVATSAERPGQPFTTYTYEGLQITSLIQEGKVQLTTEYSNGKVSSQHAPVGPAGEMCPIGRYEYHEGFTVVYDAENHKSIYRYDTHKRLNSLEKYQGAELHHIERYEWDQATGNLLSKTLEEASGKRVHISEYTYDKNQNPIVERRGDGREWHTIHRSFSEEGFNLLLRESDREDRSVHYTYLPNTNLLATEFVYEGNEIRKRTFNTYDDCAVCIRSIVDDGSESDEQSLKGVTYREITIIQPRAFLPCLGLPQRVLKKGIDASGQGITLSSVAYEYSAAGKVTKESHYDANNQLIRTLNCKYDSEGRLVEKSDALGHKMHFGYDKFKPSLIKGPKTGQEKRITYDAANRPITISDLQVDGTTLCTQMRYNKLSQIIAEIDACGHETHFTYDAFGQVIKITHPDQQCAYKEYDLLGNVIKEIDCAGYVTEKSYNFRGLPTAIYYPDGTSELFTYKSDGTLHCKEEKDGVKTQFTYDIFGNTTSIESFYGDKLLKRVSSSYSAFHKLSDTDAEGITTYYLYDFAGRKVSEKRENKEVTYTYDAQSRLSYSQEGETCYYQEYDLLDRVIEKRVESDTLHFLEKQDYDELGNCNELTNSGGTTLTEYNSYNRPLSITDPLGFQTHFEYHYQGHLVEVTISAKGIRKETHFDARGRIAETYTKSASGETLQHSSSSYDGNGNLIEQRITAFQGNRALRLLKHQWFYGPLNRLERFVEAEEKETRYHYDASGRLEKIVKPSGILIEHAYDALGRLSRYYSKDFDYHYTYDRNDRLVQVKDQFSQQTCQRSYDAFGNLTEETLGNGISLRSTYDTQSRRTSLELPDRSQVSYLYKGPYLYQVCHRKLTHTYAQRDLSGKLTHATLPAQLGELIIQRDALLRCEKIFAPSYRQQNSYDAVGNLIDSHIRDLQGEVKNDYLYDDLDHLIKENEHSYLSDSLHNRLKKDDLEYAVNHLSQVISDGESHYKYDADGNLLFDGRYHYTYDSLDRLIGLQGKDLKISYTYDSFNRRLTEKASTSQGFQEKNYLWDGDYEIGLLNPKGKLQELRVLGEGLGAEIGAALFYEIKGKSYVPLHDARGCVVSLIDVEQHKTVECYHYTAFGEELTPSKISPWRFSSKRVDQTGLTFFGRRYYHAALGRWITQDPKGFEAGPNLYAYVNNNPLTLLDLYGLFVDDDSIGLSYSTLLRSGRITGEFDFECGFTNKSRSYTTPGLELPKGSALFFINGVLNSYDDAYSSAMHLSQLSGGYKVRGIYNASHGLFDFLECNLGMWYKMATEPVKTYQKTLLDFFAAAPPEAMVLQFSHSHGGIISSIGIEKIPEEFRKRIRAIGIAPAGYIRPESCHSTLNYMAAPRRDFVPRIDIKNYRKNRDYIKILPSHPEASWFDHSFQSKTFEESIYSEIDEFINRTLK